MAELGILWAFMIVTIAVLGGLLYIFRQWLARRQDLDKD